MPSAAVLPTSVKVSGCSTTTSGQMNGSAPGVGGKSSPTRQLAHLVWEDSKCLTALIINKIGSQQTMEKLKEVGAWLRERGITVVVEKPVAQEISDYDTFQLGKTEVDFVVTLGGDGTVLYLASLFTADEPLPPVIAFAMGTLGFLTPFDATDFKSVLGRVLNAKDSPVFCTLRTRTCCEVFQNGERTAVEQVLNECLVARGQCPVLVTLQLSVDEHYLTTVQSDGLIISTPSGSTAYSMSAGGPMVAPSVAGTLITPIAPHSLSFRPLIVPECSEIVIQIPKSARSEPMASFDGRHTMCLSRGSAIRCTTSKCALPMVSLGDLDQDWYTGIIEKLRWNIPIRNVPREQPDEYCKPSQRRLSSSLPPKP